MRYYLLINVGALVGQISMVYAEKYVVRDFTQIHA
jgi:POT family proton-dependent oligopeptide transporter